MLPLLIILSAAALPTPPPLDDDSASSSIHRQNAVKATPQPTDGDDEEGVQPATQIVVTAHKLDAARTTIDAELGATAYSLDNSTIENRPGGETGSVGTILGQTPGVGLSASGLTIRGSSAVQVRINNVVVPEAISDPADRLSSRFAATTRVITGTLPAQFGFAPGGIVSITTKNGLYQHGGQLEVFAGNHGMVEPALEWSGSTGSTSLFGSGSYETGTSQLTDLAGRTADDHRREFGALAFADHVINDQNRISAIFGGSSLRDTVGATSLGAGVTGDDSIYGVGTWQHSTSSLTLQSSLFFGQSLTRANLVNRQRRLSTTMGTQIDSSYRLDGANTIRAGLFVNRQLRGQSTAATGQDRLQRTSLAVYLQDQLQLTPQLTFNAGARTNWLRGTGSSAVLEPRASLVWSGASGLSVHAGYASYSTAPSIEAVQSASVLANERDDYFGAGVQQKLGAVTLGVDGYLRNARNLIVERSTPGSLEPQAFAFRRGRFSGVEISATYAARTVNAWANLSVAHSRGSGLLAPPGLFPAATFEAVGNRWISLSSERPVSGSAGLTWHLERLALGADVAAGSGAIMTMAPGQPNGARAPAYASFGLSAVYHLHLLGRPADLRFDLTNLTDIRYLTNYAANLEGGWTRRNVGRSVMIGIEQSF